MLRLVRSPSSVIDALDTLYQPNVVFSQFLGLCFFVSFPCFLVLYFLLFSFHCFLSFLYFLFFAFPFFSSCIILHSRVTGARPVTTDLIM